MHNCSVERIHLGAQARDDEGQRDGQPYRIRLVQTFDPEQETRRDRNDADDACNDNIGLGQEGHIRSPIMMPGILPQLVTSGNEPWGTRVAGRFETHATNLLKRVVSSRRFPRGGRKAHELDVKAQT